MEQEGHRHAVQIPGRGGRRGVDISVSVHPHHDSVRLRLALTVDCSYGNRVVTPQVEADVTSFMELLDFVGSLKRRKATKL